MEKEGYAWCVGCHAGRFSGKCRGCRKPVVGEGVRVEGQGGGEWHEGCFVCNVSFLFFFTSLKGVEMDTSVDLANGFLGVQGAIRRRKVLQEGGWGSGREVGLRGL